jgi:hypothetical protein
MAVSDEQLLNLPEDNEQAFIALERLARKSYYSSVSDLTSTTKTPSAYARLQHEYLNYVQAAAEQFAIEGLPAEPPPSDTGALNNFFRDFVSKVERYTIKVRLRHSRRARPFTVYLGEAAKVKIQHLLTQIKDQLQHLSVSEDKKDALLKKILAFELELGRARTRFEIFAGLVIASADLAGEATKKLEPIKKFVDSIARVIGAAKSEEEQEDVRRLPAPAETKQIEHKPSDDVEVEPFPSSEDDEAPAQ